MTYAVEVHVTYAVIGELYSQTHKTVNAYNMSGMFVLYVPYFSRFGLFL